MSIVASTLDIGPVSTTPYDFTATVSAASNPKGFRELSVVGSMENALADTLSELVANRDARTTRGGVTGVQERVVFGAAAMANMTGDYLLLDFQKSPDGINTDWPYSKFSMKAVYIGDLA